MSLQSLHIVLVSVGLFALTFLSPGPNLLVIIQTSLAQGRTAGIVSGLGVATGDTIYAGLGLFGLAAMISSGGRLFSLIQLAGGAYLVWYGLRAALATRRMSASGNSAQEAGFATSAGSATPRSHAVLFRRGLLTDLANPQTVLFFASVFSLTLTPDTDWRLRLITWVAIALTSVLWRIVISSAFSRPTIRRAYLRVGYIAERVVGVALAGFGLRLIMQGLRRP